MSDSDGILWLMFGLLFVCSVAIAYKAGRYVEEQFWRQAIPEQMTKLCLECRGL